MRYLTSLAFCLLTCAVAAAEDQPNVVIFLTDDQGWGDLSINGNVNLETPHIDSLGEDGAMLENFYVCAVCAPTRAEFLTGRYHWRTGVSGVSEGSGRLNPDETTLANLFKDAGYATGAFGKWHNGTQSPYHPNDRGFDEYYGFTSGHWGHYFSPPLDKNGEMVKGEGYLTDDLTDHAMEFIEKNQETPFFCYIPYNTPHSPFYVDDNFYDKFAELDPELRHRDPEKEDLAETRAALAMCENIDWNVGRILQKLDELKLAENTIVLFFSDNGPNTFRWNGGMKGKKATVDEGGLRSPFLIRWPGKIEAGRRIDTVSGAIDLLPTLTELAGVEADVEKEIDGRSFAELLLNEEARLPDRPLFSVWRKKSTVRIQQFRLDQAGALFQIGRDRGQTTDVSEEHAKRAADLRSRLAYHTEKAAESFAKFQDRPFTVGYSASTTLPARDGIPHGTIKRSAKAPNNSFFENWTNTDDSITWDIEVGQTADYQATVFYTCAEGDVGANIKLATDEDSTETTVTEAFDPPLWDKSKERVKESHYFVKDWKALDLGTIQLSEGRHLLRLTAPVISGSEAIDVYSIILKRSP